MFTVIIILLFLKLVGFSTAEMEGFVVGGEPATIEEFPYSAFVTIDCKMRQGSAYWICGASLINQKILLTAAHCVYRCITGTKTTIVIGHENKLKGMNISGSGFIIHEKYVQETNDCDLALLKMKRAVKFNSRVQRVALLRNPPYNEMAKLAGWGLINEITQELATVMRKVDQKVWKRESCIQTIPDVPKGTICASSFNKKQFPAMGDSGSALVVRGFIQIGLVSYKTPGMGLNLIIYTDVGYYYDWITYNTEKLYCSAIRYKK